MKKVRFNEKEEELIDWERQQYLKHVYNDIVILSTGDHRNIAFSGMALPCDYHPYGLYSNDWDKSKFLPLKECLTLIISNEND